MIPPTLALHRFSNVGQRGRGDLLAGIKDLRRVKSAAVSGPLTFAKKTELLPLQAGDIIAYEAFKQALRDTGHDDRPRRQSLMSLENVGIGFLTEILTLEMMTDLIDQHEALRSQPRRIAPIPWSRAVGTAKYVIALRRRARPGGRSGGGSQPGYGSILLLGPYMDPKRL